MGYRYCEIGRVFIECARLGKETNEKGKKKKKKKESILESPGRLCFSFSLRQFIFLLLGVDFVSLPFLTSFRHRPAFYFFNSYHY